LGPKVDLFGTFLVLAMTVVIASLLHFFSSIRLGLAIVLGFVLSLIFPMAVGIVCFVSERIREKRRTERRK
jgi:hypothetical protein